MVAGVREVIEAAGAQLRHLPKYSPDLNPIEMAFSKPPWPTQTTLTSSTSPGS
jgi:hypothetical protein